MTSDIGKAGKPACETLFAIDRDLRATAFAERDAAELDLAWLISDPGMGAFSARRKELAEERLARAKTVVRNLHTELKDSLTMGGYLDRASSTNPVLPHTD